MQIPMAGATTISGETSVPVESYTSIAASSLVTQNGKPVIGYVSANSSYVEYTVTTPNAGTYGVKLGLASTTGAKIQISVEGANKGTITAGATGSWSNYVSSSATITLAAGTNVIRLSSLNGTQYNINSVTLTGAGAVTSKPVATVGETMAVAIDSYSGIWNSSIAIVNGSPVIGYVSASGSYVDYTINVASAGNYTLTTGLASTRAMSLDILDNGVWVGSINAAPTGGWDKFANATSSIYLSAGQQTLRFAATKGSQYNLGSIALARVMDSAPSAPMSPVSITQQWMTSFNEIDVVGTSGNDSIFVTQSGGMLTVIANGFSQEVAANGELVIWGGAGDDSLTVDSSVTLGVRLYGGDGNNSLVNATRGQATIVSIGGGADTLSGNGFNTSFWADKADTVSATSLEKAIGAVHTVSSFYQPFTTNTSATNYVPLQLNGPNLAEPASAASGLTRLSANSFFGMGPLQEDIHQGQAADCYFLTTLDSLARTQPASLRQIGVDLGDGTYAIQFKRGGVTQFVRVDGDLATNSWGGLQYSHPGGSGNMWVMMFEKAYAFFRSGKNSYSSLDYGFMTAVFNDFGVAATTFVLSADQNSFYTLANSKISASKSVSICTNVTLSNNGAPLIANHTYSVTATWRDANGTVWVTLRNPWGNDGAGADANPSDGLLTMTYGALQANAVFGTIVT